MRWVDGGRLQQMPRGIRHAGLTAYACSRVTAAPPQEVRLSSIAGTIMANSNLNLLGLGVTIVSLQARPACWGWAALQLGRQGCSETGEGQRGA